MKCHTTIFNLVRFIIHTFACICLAICCAITILITRSPSTPPPRHSLSPVGTNEILNLCELLAHTRNLVISVNHFLYGCGTITEGEIVSLPQLP